jgi:hypothetical protein
LTWLFDELFITAAYTVTVAFTAMDAGGDSTNRIEIGLVGWVIVGRLPMPHPARQLMPLITVRRIAPRRVILRTAFICHCWCSQTGQSLKALIATPGFNLSILGQRDLPSGY